MKVLSSVRLIQTLELWHNVSTQRLWLDLKWLDDWLALIVLANRRGVPPIRASNRPLRLLRSAALAKNSPLGYS